MTSLRIAGQTDVGQHRQDNQDTFVSEPLWSNHDALLIVIDGVGGYAGGAQAAALAREAIRQYMAAPTGDTLTMLREAVIHANNQIVRCRQEDPALARMCCVLTAAVADTETRRLLYVHVGDTRLYRLRQQHLEKLTHDHSLVGVREDANQLTEREAMRHPRRNEILRDVGSMTHRLDDPDFLESGETDLLPGDSLLLCSDGLTDMLTRTQLLDILARPASVPERVVELIRQANEHGGHDNITVVLAHYPVESDAADGDAADSLLPAPPASSVAITEPGPLVSPVSEAASGPAPVRKATGRVILIVLALLLTATLWWRYASLRSNEPPRPVPADSSAAGTLNAPTIPDSGRTP